jgi:threonine dehydrogenase-like Zn-dependent dehydrogenase
LHAPVSSLLTIWLSPNLRFVLGYTPKEYEASLRAIAEGQIDVAPLVIDVVGLDGVAKAFEALAHAADNAKILLTP